MPMLKNLNGSQKRLDKTNLIPYHLPMNQTPTEIIVYRSPWERDAANFWYENPEWILYIIGGIVLVYVIAKFFGKRR